MDLKRKFSDLCLDTLDEESFLKKRIIEDFDAINLNDSTPVNITKVTKDINLNPKKIDEKASNSDNSSTTIDEKHSLPNSVDEFYFEIPKLI